MDFSAQHFTMITVALITGVISPLVVQIVQYFLKRRDEKRKHSLYHHHEKEEQMIVEKLEHLMEKFNCDRVWIAEFHNGHKTYSGKSFQKFSETYEVVSQGVAAEAINTQNIPTSIFANLFKHLINNYFYYVQDTKTSKDTISMTMRSFWENRGISSFAAIAIKDIQNNFVGVLCLDGVIKKLDVKEMDIQKLISSASGLAGYLECHD